MKRKKSSLLYLINMSRIGGTKGNKNGSAKDTTPTPMWLVDEMIKMADIQDGEYVIDPCCGDNRILDSITNRTTSKHGIEIRNEIDINLQGDSYMDYCKYGVNFMNENSLDPVYFDVAILNPPFSDCQSFKFVKRLFDLFMKPRGRVIAIIPFYVLQQNVKRREWMEKHLYRIKIVDPYAFPEAKRVDCFLCEFRKEINDNLYIYEDQGQLKLI